MKKALSGLAFLALGLAAVAAQAGAFSSQQVIITATSAQGSSVTAPTSPDTLHQIGCRVNTPASATETGWCPAVNSAGTVRTCQLNSAALRTTAKAINQASFVRFEFDAASVCTRLDVF